MSKKSGDMDTIT